MLFYFDLLLIFVTSLITIRSIRLITSYKSNSLTDWTLFLLYLFQTVPVILDNTIGIPKYTKWFLGFYYAMSDEKVCIIYDLYIIIINVCLMIISIRSQRIDVHNYIKTSFELTNKIPDSLLYLLILSPAFHVLLTGNTFAFFEYNSLGERGLQSEFTELNSILVIVSILALMIWFFRKESSLPRYIILLLFSFLIIWISGKRYSVITILFSYLYMYVLERNESRRRINIRATMLLMGVAVIVYSVYYITSVKITADSSFDSVYTALRIDFGRDDVVKYTIWKEYIQKDHILEYPLQTVISTVFMAVPRFIFPAKGFPHYRYLTASLYSTDIFNIPAGMTPSILEMMISNFRLLGMPLCALLLCWYCWKADKAKTSIQNYCYAMVMMGMLTQSLDSMIILFYIVLYNLLFGNVRFKITRIS